MRHGRRRSPRARARARTRRRAPARDAGVTEPGDAARFLAPSLDHLHDPFRLAGLREAVVRLEAAVARGERIAVHGDYDVDGITSTVILRRSLELLGGQVVHFIPERLRDGYGLQPATIERLHAEGVHVIVSVDCGIRGVEAGRRAKELGVDLIITDHHEPDDELPPAVAIINPKRRDCTYPDKNLAGVGVALKLVQALTTRAGRTRHCRGSSRSPPLERWPTSYLWRARTVSSPSWASTGSRVDRTRLASARSSKARGLAGKTIDGYHIGFVLAPRVNAAGRMSTPTSRRVSSWRPTKRSETKRAPSPSS